MTINLPSSINISPDQYAKFEAYAKKWREIGLSVERANRSNTEAILRLVTNGAEFVIENRSKTLTI